MDDYNFYIQPTEQREKLFELFRIVADYLDNSKIKYWLDGGSLLGIRRLNNKPLLHDDDIDIGINIDDKKAITKVLQKIIKKYPEYKLNLCPDFYKIFYPNMWFTNEYQLFATPTIDIFFYKLVNNEYIIHSQNIRKVWPNSIYRKLYPLIKTEFNGVSTYIANDIDDYLETMYKNWQNEIIVEVRMWDADHSVKVKNIYFDNDYKYLRAG